MKISKTIIIVGIFGILFIAISFFISEVNRQNLLLSLGTNFLCSAVLIYMYDFQQIRFERKKKVEFNMYVKNKIIDFIETNSMDKSGFIDSVLYGIQSKIDEAKHDDLKYNQNINDTLQALKSENKDYLHEIVNLFYSVDRIKGKIEVLIERFEKFGNLDDENLQFIEHLEKSRLRKSHIRFLDHHIHVLKGDFERLNQDFEFGKVGDFSYSNATDILAEYNKIITDYCKK